MNVLQENLNIKSLIYEVRGKQVMLDSDLAYLYGCANGTKDINKAVKRNIERFPDNFYFQLTKEECKFINSSRFQFGTLNRSGDNHGHNLKYLPYVFTEQGVAMLSSVLRTKEAAKVNVDIMNAFVEMRRFIILDKKELYHIGSSLKDLGKKVFAISKIEDNDYLDLLLSKIKN